MDALIVHHYPQLQTLHGLQLFSAFDLSRLWEICEVAASMGVVIIPQHSYHDGFDMELRNDGRGALADSITLVSSTKRWASTRTEIRVFLDGITARPYSVWGDYDCVIDRMIWQRFIIEMAKPCWLQHCASYYNTAFCIGAGPIKIAAARLEAELPRWIGQSRLPDDVCDVVITYLRPREDFFDYQLAVVREMLMEDWSECYHDALV